MSFVSPSRTIDAHSPLNIPDLPFLAHRTEETHNAATSGSWGIITSIGVSALLGWFLILGLLFSIQDYQGTINTATKQPIAQILLDTVGVDGAIVLMVSLRPSFG